MRKLHKNLMVFLSVALVTAITQTAWAESKEENAAIFLVLRAIGVVTSGGSSATAIRVHRDVAALPVINEADVDAIDSQPIRRSHVVKYGFEYPLREHTKDIKSISLSIGAPTLERRSAGIGLNLAW